MKLLTFLKALFTWAMKNKGTIEKVVEDAKKVVEDVKTAPGVEDLKKPLEDCLTKKETVHKIAFNEHMGFPATAIGTDQYNKISFAGNSKEWKAFTAGHEQALQQFREQQAAGKIQYQYEDGPLPVPYMIGVDFNKEPYTSAIVAEIKPEGSYTEYMKAVQYLYYLIENATDREGWIKVNRQANSIQLKHFPSELQKLCQKQNEMLAEHWEQFGKELDIRLLSPCDITETATDTEKEPDPEKVKRFRDQMQKNIWNGEDIQVQIDTTEIQKICQDAIDELKKGDSSTENDIHPDLQHLNNIAVNFAGNHTPQGAE
jgi:hypothetical protein